MHPQSSPFTLALQSFLLDRQARRFSPRTLEFYSALLKPFATWCAAQDVTAPAQVTAAHVRAYLVKLEEAGRAPATLHAHVRALKTFFRFLVADEWLSASPMDKIGYPKVPKKDLPVLTAAEVARLLKAADFQRDRAIVLVFLDTGLRAAELAALEGRDIDQATGAVHVREGKGAKDRTVYLGAKARRALLRYWRDAFNGLPGGHECIWKSEKTGRPLTVWGVGQAMQRLGKRAGVPHSNPHTFRRTFALESLRGGMSIYHLQRLMGHEDLEVLKRYLPLVDTDLAAAHEKASPVDRLLK